MLFLSTCAHEGAHVAEDGIDWSFFSMARYIATADPGGGGMVPRGAWDGFL